jgi:hypothetical protein
MGDGSVEGRPSFTPCARFTASASRIRCEINRRSRCAKVAITCAMASPPGVEVSTWQSNATSAQFFFWAVAINPVKSIIDLDNRSNFDATRPLASPAFSTSSAARMPGRFHVASREASVFDNLDECPPSALALGNDRGALCVESSPAVSLFGAAHSDVA